MKAFALAFCAACVVVVQAEWTQEALDPEPSYKKDEPEVIGAVGTCTKL
jgi:hypothetical protein